MVRIWAAALTFDLLDWVCCCQGWTLAEYQHVYLWLICPPDLEGGAGKTSSTSFWLEQSASAEECMWVMTCIWKCSFTTTVIRVEEIHGCLALLSKSSHPARCWFIFVQESCRPTFDFLLSQVYRMLKKDQERYQDRIAGLSSRAQKASTEKAAPPTQTQTSGKKMFNRAK